MLISAWRALLSALVFFVCSSIGAAAEGWNVVAAPAGFGARWMAQVTNEQGHVLRVWRRIDRTKYKAMAQLVLGGGLKFGKDLPVHSIDEGPRRPLENWGEQTAVVDGGVLTWQLWASTTAELGPQDAPRAWMNGNQLVFVVRDATGKEHQLPFRLTGSNVALERVITGTYQ